jgi:glycosyltransferase involved in cell wall biosynthesis
MDPLYTIIMTSYNHARFIGPAIESVLAQTLPDWELLIVDDVSPDNSWEVITSFHDPRITAIRHETNRGGSAAYNTAYARARGEFIACLDCDDMFYPEKLQRQKEFFDSHPEIDICGTYITNIGTNDEQLEEKAATSANWFNVEWDPNDPASWIWQDRLCHSSAVVRKRAHDQIGRLDEDLMYGPDWDFWIRALVAGAGFHVIAEPLTYYRRHGGNVTHSNPARARKEYATMLARTFNPYLARIGRGDLIARSVLGFLDALREEEEGSKAVGQLLEVLLPGDSMQDASESRDLAGFRSEIACTTLFQLQLRFSAERDRALTAERLYEERGQWIAELETALRWNDEQRQLLERRVAELEKASSPHTVA